MQGEVSKASDTTWHFYSDTPLTVSFDWESNALTSSIYSYLFSCKRIQALYFKAFCHSLCPPSLWLSSVSIRLQIESQNQVILIQLDRMFVPVNTC